MDTFKEYLSDFIALSFPMRCPACGRALFRQEQVLCLFCRVQLPFTNFHLQPDNPLAKQFWGKVEIRAAASLLYFRKGGNVQRLLHQLKYRNQRGIGHYLGTLYGRVLRQSEGFAEADIICPLPLHRKRLLERGYNQSADFAAGLGSGMGKVVENSLLDRAGEQESQTRKSRFERYLNVKDAFRVKDERSIMNKHILLADDVLTTGASLGACAEAILRVKGTRVSIATIAYAP